MQIEQVSSSMLFIAFSTTIELNLQMRYFASWKKGLAAFQGVVVASPAHRFPTSEATPFARALASWLGPPASPFLLAPALPSQRGLPVSSNSCSQFALA